MIASNRLIWQWCKVCGANKRIICMFVEHKWHCLLLIFDSFKQVGKRHLFAKWQSTLDEWNQIQQFAFLSIANALAHLICCRVVRSLFWFRSVINDSYGIDPISLFRLMCNFMWNKFKRSINEAWIYCT